MYDVDSRGTTNAQKNVHMLMPDPSNKSSIATAQ